MKTARQTLRDFHYELGVIDKVSCTKEENATFSRLEKQRIPLPEGVVRDESFMWSFRYCRYVETDLTDQEISHLGMYQQLTRLESIRSATTFTAVVAGILLLIVFVAIYFSWRLGHSLFGSSFF